MKLFNDSNYVILPYQTYYNWMFKNAKTATLESDEIKTIEKLLYKIVNVYNEQQINSYKKYKKSNPNYHVDKKDFLINLEEYKFHLVPILNEKGEKEVWINCFCSTYNSDWKENIIIVKDGGKCYFNLKVNLTTKKYYDFIVNGTA